MTDAPPRRRGPLITRYRVIVSVLLAAALAGIYVALTSSVDQQTPAISSSQVLDVQPAKASIALRQDRVFARVAEGFTGVLVVDGVEIPEDQLDRREGLNAIGFTPGAGTETGALEPGRVCASVIYWPVAAGRTQSQSYEWCWQVQ